MGKVIDFKNHFIKSEQMTVQQIHRLQAYTKWKVAYLRQQIFGNNKHPKESPK